MPELAPVMMAILSLRSVISFSPGLLPDLTCSNIMRCSHPFPAQDEKNAYGRTGSATARPHRRVDCGVGTVGIQLIKRRFAWTSTHTPALTSAPLCTASSIYGWCDIHLIPFMHLRD
jgi:hypothetical protein